jgi:hypothetical protein
MSERQRMATRTVLMTGEQTDESEERVHAL